MTPEAPPDVPFAAPPPAFLRDVLDGLSRPQKRLPAKYFYDARGSQLFDRITELEAYYPTRTELGILERHADEIAGLLGDGAVLVEYGSGSSRKTRVLLDRLDLAAYVPIDISEEHLHRTAEALRAAYPGLDVRPVAADYTGPFAIPDDPAQRRHRTVFFPGSTIGNFSREEAEGFLRQIAGVVGPGGGLLIGVDLKKDRGVLERAYNDPEGVTAAFNLNVLARINRELGGRFDLTAFRHRAHYNAEAGRIEMHLESLRPQRVRVTPAGDAADGYAFDFAAGETIHTEDSHKYAPAEFAALAGRAGWAVRRVWTDDAGLFSVQYLEAGAAERGAENGARPGA